MSLATKKWVENGFEKKMVAGSLRRLQAGTGGVVNAERIKRIMLGITIENADVTVGARQIQHAGEAIVDVAETTRTVADGQYLWVEHVLWSGVATIPEASETRPKTDVPNKTVRVMIARFSVVDGAATISEVGHVGNIEIFGAYG